MGQAKRGNPLRGRVRGTDKGADASCTLLGVSRPETGVRRGWRCPVWGLRGRLCSPKGQRTERDAVRKEDWVPDSQAQTPGVRGWEERARTLSANSGTVNRDSKLRKPVGRARGTRRQALGRWRTGRAWGEEGSGRAPLTASPRFSSHPLLFHHLLLPTLHCDYRAAH